MIAARKGVYMIVYIISVRDNRKGVTKYLTEYNESKIKVFTVNKHIASCFSNRDTATRVRKEVRHIFPDVYFYTVRSEKIRLKEGDYRVRCL